MVKVFVLWPGCDWLCWNPWVKGLLGLTKCFKLCQMSQNRIESSEIQVMPKRRNLPSKQSASGVSGLLLAFTLEATELGNLLDRQVEHRESMPDKTIKGKGALTSFEEMKLSLCAHGARDVLSIPAVCSSATQKDAQVCLPRTPTECQSCAHAQVGSWEKPGIKYKSQPEQTVHCESDSSAGKHSSPAGQL